MTNPSILIVEDDGLIALRISELLKNAGYKVLDPAPSGEDALEQINLPLVPDLILMDVALAGTINGIETAQRIREHHDIPVVFMSAYSSDALVQQINKITPEGIVNKPFLENDLLIAIQRTFGRES